MRKRYPGKQCVMLAVAALAALFLLAGCGGDDEEEEMIPEETMMPPEETTTGEIGCKVTVTNNLMGKLAPVVVTHAFNDADLFTKGNYVTEAAEDQILRSWPCMVTEAIGEDAVSNHPTRPECLEENKVTMAAGAFSEPIMFNGDATALRIIAMVAPSEVPDYYVSAVVNVAALKMSGDYITAPLSRFDIGHDEMTMAITREDGDIGMVKVTRQ